VGLGPEDKVTISEGGVEVQKTALHGVGGFLGQTLAPKGSRTWLLKGVLKKRTK